MKLTSEEKKALKFYRDVLLKENKFDIKKLTLFGSKARGDTLPCSDIDIFMVVRNKEKIEDKIYNLVTDILLQGGPYLSVKIYDEKEYQNLNNPPSFFMRHVLRDGIDLWKEKL